MRYSIWTWIPTVRYLRDFALLFALMTGAFGRQDLVWANVHVTPAIIKDDWHAEEGIPTSESTLLTEPCERKLTYTLRGKTSDIQFTVYLGLKNYLAALPRVLSYALDSIPSDSELFGQWIARLLDESQQSSELRRLVGKIEGATDKRDDMLRIAVSIVQHIPYDDQSLASGREVWRFPYEVLYDNTGVCSEKSVLLAWLLRELGFATVLFDFVDENHMAVGVRCSDDFDYRETGYCFIEPTGPMIISDASETYAGDIKLLSSPRVIQVSEGYSFETVEDQYKDALLWQKLRKHTGPMNPGPYQQWRSLVADYGLIPDSVLQAYGSEQGLMSFTTGSKKYFFVSVTGGIGAGWTLSNGDSSESLKGYRQWNPVYTSFRFSVLEMVDPVRHTYKGTACEIFLYRYRTPFEDRGVEYGDIEMSGIGIVPGLQVLRPRFAGVNIFMGFLGAGLESAEFLPKDKGRAHDGDSITVEDIDFKNAVSLIILPMKFEIGLFENLSLGLCFSGFIYSNHHMVPTSTANAANIAERFERTNAQILGVVSIKVP